MKPLLLITLVSLMVGIPVFSQTDGVSTTGVEWKKVEGVNMPIPPKEHPRLYLRSPQVAELPQRLNDPVIRKVWNDLKALERDRSVKQIPEKPDWRFYFDTQGLLTRVELKALNYLLTNNPSEDEELS